MLIRLPGGNADLQRSELLRRCVDELPLTLALLVASVTEAELHWKFFFIVFQLEQIGVFEDGFAIARSESQMRSANRCRREDKVPNVRFDPRLRDKRERGNDGKEGEVFEERESETRLFALRLAGKSHCSDIDEENVSEQQTHAGSDKQLACCCLPGEEFRWGEVTQYKEGSECDNPSADEHPDLGGEQNVDRR